MSPQAPLVRGWQRKLAIASIREQEIWSLNPRNGFTRIELIASKRLEEPAKSTLHLLEP